MSERNGLEIAIVGLAGRFPGANDLRQLWENLRRGVESIQRFSDEELAAAGVSRELLANPRYVKAGTVIEGADLLDAEFFGLTPREAEIIDPQHRLFLECAWEALEAAGYDTETYRRPIGVYAGVSFSSYTLLNVWSNRDRIDFLGSLLGSDKDHLATLVSYKLNLEGPSLAVQTACSTSLVAVHLAAQGLLNGECDMALAGGSSLRFPQRSGYLWTEGGMSSPDGHCRAFDAAAAGTVFGDGVGIVVLKRLEDAEADGDTIHAVIKGSAINNDGAAKVAYAAPRMEGQAKVVRAAQAMAEVEPGSIGYVEAHGTATPLGDPIELAALTEAFRAGTSRRSFCALGSVKTNIGHLNAAAGVAGLIKAVLALENRTIPPSLHFERPNPQIDLAASPFFVNAAPVPWEAGDGPRRAGVHAFGMGGTNAHVILEEAPERAPSGPSRAWQMLVLSARTPAALEAATDRLAGHLAAHPEASLADVAHTLHRGRRAFAHRRVVLAGSLEQAVQALESRDPERVLTAAEVDRERPVFFAFAAGGAPGAAAFRALYDGEPVFRQEVDRCAELLGRPVVSPPPLFVVEHALARLWMAWGVRPEGMLGQGVGELVAASLAGVLTLAEALRLAVLHDRLLADLPAGAALPAAALAAVAEAFAAALGTIELKAPSLPFVSRETGRWITAAEATYPAYWLRGLAAAGSSSEGLAALPADGVLLDVGPEADPKGLVRSLGSLWLAGVRPDWRAYYAGERRRRVPLPAYPFERRRYWIDPRPETAVPAGPQRTFHPRPANLRTAYVPPSGRVEAALAGIWQDLFGIAEIGGDDDFYDLGGHSLLITRMASRVREALGVELALRVFFEERTIARLAAAVERHRVVAGSEEPWLQEAPPLVRGVRPRDLPLSFSQQRLWLLDQLAPGNPFYNLSAAVRIAGELRVDALEAALREVVRRHETLRTGFGSQEGRPIQRIAAAVPFGLHLVDLSALSVEEREDRVRRLAAELSRRPFDLSRPPLLRASLVRLAAAEHVLLWCIHHIVSDGWSRGVLVTEVARLYAAFVKGEPSPLPELAVQYADFALWQRGWLQGEVLERQLAYWRQRLAGAPVVEFPADRPRPPVQSFRGALHSAVFPAELSAAVAALARQQALSPYMVLLAAFLVVVRRYTGLEDVVVGTPIANRTRGELEGLIGFFVNTLVLRTGLGGDPVLTELLARVRETALGAYAHQDLPFEYLVEKLQPQRDLSRNPLFQLLFNLLNTPLSRVESGGLVIAPLPAEGSTALLDLQVYLSDTASGLGTTWEYSTDLFDAATVERLAGHFGAVLEGIVARPEARLSELALLTAGERDQILVEWNATGRTVPVGCVHEEIAVQAARTPDAVAVVYGGESLTYGKLERRANGLAHQLRRLGVGPEVRVGIALERSLEMVVGLLAVLKAGGAYVPLDPSYPAERLAFMREDAGLATVLTPELLSSALPESDVAPASGVGPQNLAYVIYTSGSTGRPKGVQVPHGALTNFLASMAGTPGLTAADRLLAVTSLSFDIAGLELYLPLLVGGRIVLASRDEAADGRRLQRLIADSGATVLQATPATWRLLLESGWPGGEGLKALCGGEALSPVLAASLQARVGSLWNVYGPTETTVWSTLEEVRGGGPILIGRPIANTEAYVLDVLDDVGQPVPVGVPGELLLGGVGLARGYLGRPELTAERFVPSPFGAPGSRLYRTGDLARWRHGGALECLGRIDYQVKVRGFRIELGEVEAALARHPEVSAAVVVARDEASGDRRLVAYVVPRRAGADLSAELRTWVRRSLPEHMVPSVWVSLAELPLTPNGKVDRKALPAPEAAKAERVSAAPRTPTEEALADILATVLGVADMSPGDSFFDLGGHSLLATQAISRIRKVFGVELPLRRFFETPTLAGLAGAIDAAHSSRPEAPLVAVTARFPDRSLPLSFAQQRLWLLDQLAPGNPFYNLSGALRIEGELRIDALAAALREVVRRHGSLRTGFGSEEGRPVQRIAPAVELDLPLVDLSALPAAERQARTRRLAAELAMRPFDLSRPPLLRVSLLRLEKDEHVLLFSLHHIVSDRWSMGVLTAEVARLYGAFVGSEPSPLPELPVQYADFALWQRDWLQGEALERQLAYWRERLAGAPVVELPTDRPRPPVQSFRGARHSLRLAAERLATVEALAREHGVSFFMALLGAFQVLVHRYTGLEDVVVGTPIANRTHSELEGLIGFFINSLVMRTGLWGDPVGTELLARVRETALGSYAHQDLPFEYLVEKLQPQRDLSRNPLFQLMFNLLNTPESAVEPGDLRITGLDLGAEVSLFDLQVYVSETGDGLATVWEYSTDLFDAATVERLAGHFLIVLQGLASRPGARVSELPLLTALEQRQLLVNWNATRRAAPERCVHEMIAAQAARTPEAVAVVCGGDSLTYGELDRRANFLADHLRRLGVGPEVLVGIALERSLEMVVGLLAVLKAGGSYLPLDPSYPAERLAFMREDAGVKVLLSQETLPEAGESARAPESGVGPLNLAYVIYTSGSTGRPKGVQIPHGGLMNFLASMIETPGLTSGDTLLALASLSFDIAGLELYLPLLMGGRVVVASREDAADGQRLQALIAESGATVLQATPATWRLLLESGWQGGEGLKALCGAEALSPVLAAALLARVSSLWNVYGPTETTVWSTVEEIRGDGPILIGRPIANIEAHVADGWGHLVPAGVPGELLLGGAGLARGYLGRPELTAEKFVPNPFGEPGSRLYRTGDLARWRPEGILECLGRIDHQVKVRGFRIELGEIEAALARHPEVSAAVVVAREEASGDRRLAAYVVPRRAGADHSADLRTWVRQSLPDYMVPSVWVSLAELPLTPSGKVDRKALPVPGSREEARELTAPRTPVEEVLIGIWARVLGIAAVGLEDSFFDLGGHSLLATQMVSRMREDFGVELPLRRVFEKPTVAALAAEVEALQSRERGFEAPPLRTASREGDLPLSFAQERLWFLDQLQPGSAAYNVPVAVRLTGRLDVAALAATLGEIVRRHESLRTAFAVRSGRPVQRIAPAVDLLIPVVDLGSLKPGQREVEVRALTAEEALRPFDLRRAPLLRAVLARLAGDEHALLLTLHHIASDAWSAGVLVREMVALYRSFSQGEPSTLPALPVQYADFAVWQRGWLQGEALETQLAYWRAVLAEAPVLQLATDRPRMALQGYRGADAPFLLTSQVIEGVRALSRQQGATPFMVLLAGFEALLQRYTGQSDVIVGSTIANRTRSELEGLIGFFINTLALRADLSGEPTFLELLVRARESALGAYAHQDLPFEKLVAELQPERDLSRSPLFQVLFQLQNAPMDAEPVALPGLELRPMGAGGQTAKFDLVLNVHEAGAIFAGVLKYNTDLFEPATAARIVRHFATLLAGAMAAPSRRLSELPLLSPEERHQLAREWNEAPTESLGSGVLHERFALQAARSPEATAVVCEGERLSYGDLDRRSNRLARYLIRLGVLPGDRVGLCLERSVAMAVAILGVLKAGASYVPLDPAYPQERLAFLLADSRPPVVLTQESLAALLPEPGAGTRVVFVDRDAKRMARERVSAPKVPVSAEHPAYVIYTSGSTGQPKGVVVRHGNALRLFSATERWFGFGPEDVWTLFHSYAFDFSVWEIWGALLHGGRLVVVPYWVSRSPEAFYELLRSERVTVLNQTPSAFRQLIWAEETALAGAEPDLALRYVIFGGEALEPAGLAPWFERHGDERPRLINMYGITETTVHVTWREVGRADMGRAVSAVGCPIPDLGVYLLDSSLQPVPVGVPGEMHVSGAGLAEGYLGRPELTAERFVPNPFGEAGSRLYRSGDLARRLPDGDLEYLGRIDHQVKIRGFRIELGEIESALV
ncbi:MAG TPA: amino acid adenylation domain-containing protein, partial [Thermoanaerobaculia bacterium]|nr:amino acid adenylation domain-containing protein [Thermoanaerobaculia bacterium]